MMDEPLSPTAAKQLIREILELGNVWYDTRPQSHLMVELANDHMDIQDCFNVLPGGTVEPAEWENGAWRYGVRTSRMYVVIEFEAENVLFLVTA